MTRGTMRLTRSSFAHEVGHCWVCGHGRLWHWFCGWGSDHSYDPILKLTFREIRRLEEKYRNDPRVRK